MKKIIYCFILVSLIFTACEKDEEQDQAQEVLGCTDDCALNYDAAATDDDGSCMYSFLGTYTISEYKLDGVSLFSEYWENPLVNGAISFGVTDDGSIGVYGFAAYYADGSELVQGGTFTNTETQLIMYGEDNYGNVTVETWTTTKINCLEFDGSMDVDGALLEIELTYSSSRMDYLERTPTIEKFDVNQFNRKK